jgi:ribosomal protein S7
MSRRRDVPKRKILPDPIHRDKLVAKFTNTLMIGGKKSTAEGILYGSFEIIKSRFKEDPLEVFRKALDNVKPKLEVKSRRSRCAGSCSTRALAARRRCASASPQSSWTRPRCAAAP